MHFETASLHLSILLHYYYFNPYKNPVLKLQPRSNSAIPFQIPEKYHSQGILQSSHSS